MIVKAIDLADSMFLVIASMDAWFSLTGRFRVSLLGLLEGKGTKI